MELLVDLELEVGTELEKIELEKNMPYITSIERQGIPKGREEGLEEGGKKGREEGVMSGQILLLQQLLGQSVETEETLAERPLNELKKLVAELRQKIDSRNR